MTNAATKNGSNGVHPDAAITPEHDLLWDSLSPRVVSELEKPLDLSLVSQRKGRAGRTYQYIEGHTVIDQANEIFGRGGWGYELVGDVTLREIDSVDPKTGEISRIRAYSAPVRVTVPGVPPRTDIGFHAVAEETAEGHDTACKGSVTDGLKRALRSFGDQFGNCLYGDQAATGQPAKQDSAADSLAPSLRATLIDLGAMQGFDEKQVRAAVRAYLEAQEALREPEQAKRRARDTLKAWMRQRGTTKASVEGRAVSLVQTRRFSVDYRKLNALLDPDTRVDIVTEAVSQYVRVS